MKLTENRVDASLLSEEERALLGRWLELGRRGERPCLKAADGTEVPLPQAVFEVLLRIIEPLRQGRAVVVLPEDETFTTQAAADFLGMSRQHFVQLLESGEMPFHRVGTHRRVYFRDLLAYVKRRDAGRRATLSRLFERLQKEGHYDTDYVGEDAR